MSFLPENLEKKWAPLLDDKQLPGITDAYRRAITGILLENQEAALRSERGGAGLLSEAAPANQSGAFPTNPNLQGFDPIMIALVRRTMPNLVAYDICGVQPMTGPTGLIFALRAKYATQGGDEALFQEANTSWAGANLNGAHVGSQPGIANSTNYTSGLPMSTLEGEGLGTSGNTAIPEMAFGIDKVTVTAKTRALKAEYTVEIQQDLKAVHNLDAEAELANILSAEILAEINREVVRTVQGTAVTGADSTTTPGIFDLDVDSSGRWSVEKFKGLVFQIDREANAIARAVRRGKGNILICSSDLASALHMADVLDYGTKINTSNMQVDDTGNTFVGTLLGRYKVFIDPYASATTNYFVVGYRGSSPYDAGLFYCPYVPLQMMRGQDPGSFQPKIGFKTRYGMVSNPFATANGSGHITYNTNQYYRRVRVNNLL